MNYYLILALLIIIIGIISVNVLPFILMWRKIQTRGAPFGKRFNVREFHQLVRTVKPKDFTHVWIGPELVTCAIDPEAAKFVLTPKPDISKEVPPWAPSFKRLTSSSVVFINGDDWKLHRSLVNPAFNETAYHKYFPKMVQLVNKALQKFEEERVFKGGILDMNIWASRLTLDVLGSTIFDKDFGMLDDKIHDYYESYKTLISRPPILDFIHLLDKIEFFKPTKNLHDAATHIKGFIKQIIQERKEDTNSDHSDIVSYILQGEKLTEDQIIVELFTYFVAGHETTAMAIQWLMYELVQNPEVQEKLYEEIVRKFGKDGEVKYEDLELGYWGCVISENLRLNPPAAILPSRRVQQDISYNGITIPKGSLLAVNYYSLHRNEEYWEDPEKFDPDRFLPERKKDRHRFAFIPFAAGPRQCIGKAFSLIQQNLFIIRLLQKYRLIPPKTGSLYNPENRPLLSIVPRTRISLELR